MFTVKVFEDITRPPGEVFLFAGGYRNDPTWRAGVTRMVIEGSDAPAVGVTTKETMRSLGQTAVTVAEITEFSDTRTGFRSLSGPVPCEGTREFLRTPGGTRMTYSLTLRPKGVMRLFEPILAFIFRRQVAGDMRRLRLLLEQGRSS